MNTDQVVMSEAADEIAELRAKVASLQRRIVDLEQELEREQGLNEMAADNAREQFDEDRAEYEEKIEFLETDRLRLANLIHPDSGICTVYAGKCWECDKEMKRLDEQTANLIRREADAKAARGVVTRSLDLQRQINQNLTLQQEQRNADVRALCDAVSQLMPTSRMLKPLVEKVRKGLE